MEIKQIELATWAEIKAIIDGGDIAGYDHADISDINRRTIIVKQSSKLEYYYFMRTVETPAVGSDQEDYDNNYASGVSRGNDDDSINVNISGVTGVVYNSDAGAVRYWVNPDISDVTCNPTTYTEMYATNLPSVVEFAEILINVERGNTHWCKVEFGNGTVWTEIIETEFQTLKDLKVKGHGASNFLAGEGTRLYRITLSGNFGTHIRVSQKRRDSSTAKCKINGMILTYKEAIIV